MTTPTNARQTSERERLVLPMTASMVPHPMYASGWNACLDASKEVLDYQHAEIERLRAENEALRTDAARYRELRQGDLDDIAIVHGIGTSDSGISGVVYTYQIELTGDELDKAIDVRSKESRRG